MTLNELITMAQLAGAVSYSPPPTRSVEGVSLTFERLDAFAKLVATKEREACAMIAEQRSEPGTAAFIRARSEM
jgi:hypothetical protein